ncbi:hypothetical protein DIPPA_23174 [Diplonema papillatum]|nr:hypothetical protein DIPPA_23174 [Diplonema papillatum]
MAGALVRRSQVNVEHPNSPPGKKKWKEVNSGGKIPLGRIGHSICDNGAGKLYLWGGVNETLESGTGKYLDDFFEYNFHKKQWAEIDLRGKKPKSRAFHSAVCYKGNVTIFGGCNGRGRFDEISKISTKTGGCIEALTKGEKPPSRYCHTSVEYKGKMLVFGGKCGGRNSNKRLADMFEYDLNTETWTEVVADGKPPSSRSAHTAVVYGKKMLVFGGRDANGHCCEDFHEYHLEAKFWRQLDYTHPLLHRARHSAVVHAENIIIFGGWSGKKKLNDLCVYNLDTNTITLVHDTDEGDASLPCRRECHTTVVVDNKLFLFGGRFRGVFMNDSFEYPLPRPSLQFLLRNWFVDNNIPIPSDDSLPPTVKASLEDYKRRFVDDAPTAISPPPIGLRRAGKLSSQTHTHDSYTLSY